MKERRYQPYHDNLVTLARLNRKNPTPAEQAMRSRILRKRQLADFKFLRQKPIDGYIVDFYCASLPGNARSVPPLTRGGWDGFLHGEPCPAMHALLLP